MYFWMILFCKILTHFQVRSPKLWLLKAFYLGGRSILLKFLPCSPIEGLESLIGERDLSLQHLGATVAGSIRPQTILTNTSRSGNSPVSSLSRTLFWRALYSISFSLSAPLEKGLFAMFFLWASVSWLTTFPQLHKKSVRQMALQSCEGVWRYIDITDTKTEALKIHTLTVLSDFLFCFFPPFLPTWNQSAEVLILQAALCPLSPTPREGAKLASSRDTGWMIHCHAGFSFPFHSFFIFFWFHIAQAGLKLSSMTLNFWSPCSHPQSCRITSVHTT